jgi:Flp pilus assembly protein CpaB
MKGGSKLFIFAGVGLALVAIALLISSLGGGGKTTADEETANQTVKIVEAKSAVPAHALLTIDALLEREVPAADAPADAITSITEAAGMAYRVPLAVGQPLLRSQIETPGLRNDIATGKRAIAIPVDEISSMSGLVQDGDFIDIIFHARINLTRILPSEGADVTESGDFKLEKPMLVPFGEDVENHPMPGEENSTFIIRDDVGDAGELEAVAKIMLQDIRILRVVRPGDQFLPDGTLAGEGVAGEVQPSEQASVGQFILEVTPQQAELVTFIQDDHHQYQFIVRGKDDHETITTSGITYDILTAEEWGMPWPKSVTLDENGEVVAKETPDATPAANGEDAAADGEEGGE